MLIIVSTTMNGQNVEGFVYGNNEQDKIVTPLPGASVFWLVNLEGTSAGTDGSFILRTPPSLPAKLVVSYVGYQNDTVLVNSYDEKLKIILKGSIALKEFVVEGKQEATIVSTIKTINSEQIGQKELLKAACCNLSESFETNPSVTVSYSDAITGAKEIQMLGLSGIYSQVMTENIPAVRGIGSAYGLNYVPGPWMESIQITKGSGSVANGYESFTGQINVEYLKPDKADKFYLNLYGASTGNMELNLHRAFDVNSNWKSVLFIHGENSPFKWDHQDDGFLDMPLVTQGNIFNRWSYNDGKKFEGQFGVKVLAESRNSGQVDFDKSRDLGTTNQYGVEIKTKRFEAFSKTGLIFPETPWKSAGLILSGSFHEQNSFFGLKTYDGKQKGFYGSLIYMSIIGTTDHKWKAGLDLRYDDYNEEYLLQPFNRNEVVPGLYAEYTLNIKEKLGVVAGSRIDHHNEHGWFYTPRLHAKYNFTPDVILRASGGHSFRTANVFSDNIAIMATSRDLVIAENLQPEEAWNYGTNLTAKFRLDYRPGSVSVDYYITDFTNQVVVDTYTSMNEINLYNLKGNSYSRSFQIVLNYEVLKRLDFRIAYKNDDVVTDYNGTSYTKPLVAKNKGLLNISYLARKEKWRFDFTTQYEGEKKLALSINEVPDSPGHGDQQIKDNTSPEFYVFNGQITRIFKSWEVYAGVENAGDFRQENPVIHADAPFESGFDATNVWGPVMGRKIYMGFRYKINDKDKNKKI